MIAVHYRTFAALKRDADTYLAHGGLYLQRDLQQAQFSVVDVELTAPDGEAFSLAGEVVTVVPGTATAIQLGPATKAVVAALRKHVAAQKLEGAAPADDPQVLTAAELGDDGDGDGEDQRPLRESELSLQAKIDTLSVAELRKEALHGSKDMRFLLARHLNKTLHSFVLKNPAIGLDEIEQLARMTSFNPNALHEISINRDWTKSGNVVRALVRNPKTPMPDALRLVEKLPLGECQAMVKSGALRMALLNALKRRVKNDPG